MKREVATALVLFSAWPNAVHTQQFTNVVEQLGVADDGVSLGVAWRDYDQDGDLDLYVSNAFTPNRLFRNDGNVFTDVAPEAGLADEVPTLGVAWGDYDADGDPDLYTGRGFTFNALYQNNGDGTFIDAAKQAGVEGLETTTFTVSWIDVDNDGDLDLHTANENFPSHLYTNNGDGTFHFTPHPFISNAISPSWADFDADGDLDLFAPGQPKNDGTNVTALYRNDGGELVDIAPQAGLDQTGYSICAAWGDFDGDLDLDVYVSNNDEPNKLYRNNGDTTFTDVAAQAGVADDPEGFVAPVNTSIWGDFDGDSDLDLFVTNGLANGVFPHRFFRNNGTGSFTEVADQLGLANIGGWGAAAADYDADGDLDLYVNNGRFEDGGLAGAPNRLYRNEGHENRWLSIRLQGTQSNLDAFGARLLAVAGGQRQLREINGESGLYSQGSLDVEFGFGSVVVVDSLIILWPAGGKQVLTDVPTNQQITVTEDAPSTVVERLSDNLPATFTLKQNYPNPFNAQTIIPFSLQESRQIRLTVLNTAGQSIRTLATGRYGPGIYHATWDGRDAVGETLASGVYLYRLTTGTRVTSRKLLLLQ